MTRVLKMDKFYLHTHTFIRNRNDPYLSLPSQLYPVVIYRPRRDGRLVETIYLPEGSRPSQY